MRLAIADPPYLGRADRWYGDGRGPGRASTTAPGTGRNGRKPDRHPDAAYWDTLEAHVGLILNLENQFDGWAMAAHADRVHELMAAAPARARMCVWVRPNAMPGGARLVNRWEPVIVRPPDSRIGRGSGVSVSDVLVEPVRRNGFLGSKPAAWTRWVLTLLGARPGDTVVDLFPGSGAVEREIAHYLAQEAATLDVDGRGAA